VYILMAMNFEATEAAAANWLESHEDFQLVYADKSERRLQFTCSRLRFPSFFIVSPASVDGNWVGICSLRFNCMHSYCKIAHFTVNVCAHLFPTF